MKMRGKGDLIRVVAIVLASSVFGAIVGTVVFYDWESAAGIPDTLARVRFAAERQKARSSHKGRTQSAVEEGVSGPASGMGRRRTIAEFRSWSGVGSGRSSAVRVDGVRSDGRFNTRQVDAGVARRGLGTTIMNALRKRGKAPKDQRDAKLTHDPFSSEEQKTCAVFPGDVFLTGLPMIDQGQLAYCAVASAARVLQGYGIEITMEDMAALADSSETGGTNIWRWDQALRKVASEHGLNLKTVTELNEIQRPLSLLLDEYNRTAYDMGYERLDRAYYLNSFHLGYKRFISDREYEVQREVMISNDDKRDAFNVNVTARIDDSDPLFWTVTLGDVPEETAYGEYKYTQSERGSHMRLIIGYNEDRDEVLYSDSWGEGHELKRMNAYDALSITRGMYYLTDKGENYRSDTKQTLFD